MINWLVRKRVDPMSVMPGDSITLTYQDNAGRRETVKVLATEAATYDVMAIGDATDELGFKRAIVGVVGAE